MSESNGCVVITKIPKNSKKPEDFLLYKTIHSTYLWAMGNFIKVNYTEKSYVILQENFIRHKDVIQNFHIRESDVIVMGHPRTGVNWMSEMLWCIDHNCDLVKAKGSILRDRFPRLEESIIARPVFNPRNSFNYINNQKSPRRYIRTFLPWSMLPKTISKAKIIYVARNPKDVSVSCYYYFTLALGLRTTLDNFVQMFTKQQYLYGPYWSHVLDAWQHRHFANVLFITYEEMSTNLPQVIYKVSHFMEKHLSQIDIVDLMKHLEFSQMKNNPAVNYSSSLKVIPPFLRAPGNSEMNSLRNGKVANYLEELNDNQIFLIDKMSRDETINTNFDLNIFKI